MSTHAPAAYTAPDRTTLIPQEGWVVQHLFYQIDHGFWAALTPEEKRERLTHFTATLADIRSAEKTQLISLAIVGPKADLGLMLLTPSLHDASRFEKRLNLALGPDVLNPVYSYLSMTEWTEYSKKYLYE